MNRSKYFGLSAGESMEQYKAEIKRNKVSSVVILCVVFALTLGLVIFTGKYMINLAGMLLTVLIYFSYKGRNIKSFEDLRGIYFIDCDPEKWLAVLDLLVDENPNPGFHNTFCMYRADAYFGIGEYERMKDNLSAMKAEQVDLTMDMSRIALWENYFFKMRDEKGMDYCLKEFSRIRTEKKIPKRMYGAINEMEDIRNLHRAILREDWEEVIRIVKKRMSASIPAMQMNYRYYLGMAYKNLGEKIKARNLFEEVVALGGTLKTVSMAREALVDM